MIYNKHDDANDGQSSSSICNRLESVHFQSVDIDDDNRQYRRASLIETMTILLLSTTANSSIYGHIAIRFDDEIDTHN